MTKEVYAPYAVLFVMSMAVIIYQGTAMRGSALANGVCVFLAAVYFAYGVSVGPYDLRLWAESRCGYSHSMVVADVLVGISALLALIALAHGNLQPFSAIVPLILFCMAQSIAMAGQYEKQEAMQRRLLQNLGMQRLRDDLADDFEQDEDATPSHADAEYPYEPTRTLHGDNPFDTGTQSA